MPLSSKPPDVAKRVSYPVAIAELTARDPLFTELCSKVREASITQGENELQASTIAALQQELSIKYGGAVHVDVPYPPNESTIRFVLSDFEKTRAMSYTLSTVTFADGSWGPEKAIRISNVYFPDPVQDPVPALYVRVDLSRTTLWDLDRLAGGFKEVLRKAFAITRGNGAPSDPSKLAFLKTVRQDVFYRDLKRYDLHVNHGLTYRLIGFLEAHGRTSIPDVSLSSHQVGRPISIESSVSDSVRRIYAAIHRVNYNRKSMQVEEGTESKKQYHCKDHGDSCPNSCPELKKFVTWFNKNHRTVSLITRPYAT